jgi:CheY-like chemotaxis protein
VSKILVVDDDPTTRHLITHQLRRAGYTVADAADGQKALERVRREPFDLILLDVWMPELDGLEVLARLCQEPKPPRVVMMTADDASDTLLRAIRQQAYSYLTKPVEPKQLL